MSEGDWTAVVSTVAGSAASRHPAVGSARRRSVEAVRRSVRWCPDG